MKRVATAPVYYLKVPLALVPPNEMPGGQEAFDHRVSWILDEARTRGEIVGAFYDNEHGPTIVKEGGNKDVEVGVFRVTTNQKENE